MDRLSLLRTAFDESVPKLKIVFKRFQELFPELKLRPNALERVPDVDTFVTTNLEHQYGEITGIKSECVNTQTKKVVSRLRCEADDASKTFKFQKLDNNDEVVMDLTYSEGDSIQSGLLKNIERGINGQTETLYNSNGEKIITIRDKFGQVISEEKSGLWAKQKTVFAEDRSSVTTINQDITKITENGATIKIGETITNEERNASNQLTKLTRNETIYGKTYESFVEINPENGRVVKFSLPGNITNRNMRLNAEYAQNGFDCKSFNYTMGDKNVLTVVFDEAGKPIQASGSYIDVLKNDYKLTDEQILAKVRFNPIIDDDKVIFGFLDRQEIDCELLKFLQNESIAA